MPPDTVRTAEEKQLQGRTAGGRLFQLDALRGLAAFCVIWYHLRLALPGSTRSHNPIVVIFTSGHQAVVLFFVLSGFVLGMPFWKGRQAPYPRYLLRRFFRIYVPYFVGLLLAWAFAEHFLYRHLPLTGWYYKTWQSPLTLALFVREVFFSATPAVNTAFWSLRVEAEFSVLLPIFAWLVLRLRAAGILALCVASYAVGMRVVAEEWQLRLLFFPMFFLGMLLSLYGGEIAAWWRRLPAAAHWVMLLAGVGLYLHVIPASPVIADALTGVGSCLLIVCSLYSRRLAAALRHNLPEYLGRVSYSLYLVHGTVLFASLDLMYGRVPLWALGAIYGVCALALAHLLCIGVEEPAMRLGRRLTA